MTDRLRLIDYIDWGLTVLASIAFTLAILSWALQHGRLCDPPFPRAGQTQRCLATTDHVVAPPAKEPNDNRRTEKATR